MTDAPPGPPPAGRVHRPPDVRLALVAAACWAATAVGVWEGSAAAWSVAAGAGAGGAAAAAAALRGGASGARRTAVWGTAAAVLLTGCGFAAAVALRAHAVEANPVRQLYGRHLHLTATVDDDPVPIAAAAFAAPGEGRVLVHATLRAVRTSGRDTPASGAVVVFAPAQGWDGLLPGQRVRFHGRLSAPQRRGLTVATVQASGGPGAVGRPSGVQGIAGAVRARFARVCTAVLGPREAGLLRGLVLGDVGGLPQPVADDFRAAGLSHLTAVSGSNFALVCGLVLLVVRPLGPRRAALGAALAIVGFTVLVRPSPSVLRAAVMGGIGLGALVTGRRRRALPALGAAVLALLAWRPALAIDPGFAMSALATAAIVTVVPTWTALLHRRGLPVPVAEQLAVAVAAHAATIPVVAAMAGTLSTVAVAANLLAAPAVAPATVLGALAAAAGPVWGWGAGVLARCAGPAVWWLAQVAQWCAGLPGASITVPGGAAGGLLAACAVAGVCAWYASRRFRWCAVVAVAAAEAVWLPAHWTGPG